MLILVAREQSGTRFVTEPQWYAVVRQAEAGFFARKFLSDYSPIVFVHNDRILADTTPDKITMGAPSFRVKPVGTSGVASTSATHGILSLFD